MFPSIQVQSTDPPPKPIRNDMSNQQGSQSLPGMEDINPNINSDFEENSPFQEGVISETFQRLRQVIFFKNLRNWGTS